MKIFLDTSSLFKLYHREMDTAELENTFSTTKVTDVYLAEITKIEFSSAVWKKVRTKEIKHSEAQTTLDLFESDFSKYCFVTTASLLIEQARMLCSKYGTQGLRTLDSIQLATAISLIEDVNIFLSRHTFEISFPSRRFAYTIT